MSLWGNSFGSSIFNTTLFSYCVCEEICLEAMFSTQNFIQLLSLWENVLESNVFNTTVFSYCLCEDFHLAAVFSIQLHSVIVSVRKCAWQQCFQHKTLFSCLCDCDSVKTFIWKSCFQYNFIQLLTYSLCEEICLAAMKKLVPYKFLLKLQNNYVMYVTFLTCSVCVG